MTRSAVWEYAAVMRPRYWAASRKQRGVLLHEFAVVTGYHRKAAIRLLRGAPATTFRRRGRPRRYGPQVTAALRQVWEAADRIGSRRLHPFLSELVAKLEQHGELRLAPAVRADLLRLATLERRLAELRRHLPRRRQGTKPGTLLKHQIPIRTFAEWDDAVPGFLEIDLVEHNGGSTRGTYCYSLNTVDIVSGWVEPVAQPNRGQAVTKANIETVRARLPLPLKGLDSDSGSEFINAQLLRYCQTEQITFTRSRPSKKNDQAHIEQKNWTVGYVGYDRFAGDAACAALNHLYRMVRLYVNFFQPVVKLVSKEREGPRCASATTPPRRPTRGG